MIRPGNSIHTASTDYQQQDHEIRLPFKTFCAMNDFDEMSLNINDDSGKQLSENSFFCEKCVYN